MDDDIDGLKYILIVLCTFLCPPIGVLILAGCTADLIINILLCLLGYLPGIIHGLYCIVVYYEKRAHARRSAKRITSITTVTPPPGSAPQPIPEPLPVDGGFGDFKWGWKPREQRQWEALTAAQAQAQTQAQAQAQARAAAAAAAAAEEEEEEEQRIPGIFSRRIRRGHMGALDGAVDVDADVNAREGPSSWAASPAATAGISALEPIFGQEMDFGKELELELQKGAISIEGPACLSDSAKEREGGTPAEVASRISISCKGKDNNSNSR